MNTIFRGCGVSGAYMISPVKYVVTKILKSEMVQSTTGMSARL